MKKKKIGVDQAGAPAVDDAPEQRVVKCAFCKGQGSDPFELLSPLATCQVCNGSGQHTLDLPGVVCAYCGGSGVHPHSRLTCTSCTGIGWAPVAENSVVCPACSGTGRARDYEWPDSPLSCNYCRGVGVVSDALARRFERKKL